MKKTFILPLDSFQSETNKVIWVNYPELASHDSRWTSLDHFSGFCPKDSKAAIEVVLVNKVKLYSEYWWKVILEVNEGFELKMHPQFTVKKEE